MQWVTEGLKERPAAMELEDCLVLLDPMDQLGRLGRRENKAQEVHLDLQDQEQWLDHLVSQVQLVLLDLLDLLVLMVNLELKVKLEKKVRRERRGLQDLRERQENLVLRD